jgi:hypothetical protein
MNGQTIEQAHKLIGQAGGSISLMLSKKRLLRGGLHEAAVKLRRAADLLDGVTGEAPVPGVENPETFRGPVDRVLGVRPEAAACGPDEQARQRNLRRMQGKAGYDTGRGS